LAKLALLVLPVSDCAVGAKPNVPMCGWQNFKIFCAVGNKIKHEALGSRVGKKSAVKFICRPVVSIIDCQFNGCRVLRLPITDR